MAYLKFTADRIFDGKVLQHNQVLITAEDGRISELVDVADAGDDVQSFDGILSPGFINCHSHLELSHLKGQIPRGTGLIGFIGAVMQSRSVGKEAILDAIVSAQQEMLAEGIVAVGDICNTSFTLEPKKKAPIRYHNFIEALGFSEETAAERFEAARRLYEIFVSDPAISLSRNSIVPHAPYSIAPGLFKKIADFPGNQLLSMHNQETPEENELFLQKSGGFIDFYQAMGLDLDFFRPSGQSSLQTILPYLHRNQRMILVHNVHTTAADLSAVRDYAATRGALFSYCFCPNANLFISGTLPDVSTFLHAGVEPVLGTDSLASNDRLSIIAEMKTISNHFPLISVEELLSWATINGARALQMEELLGSFEAGKMPGVLVCAADLSSVTRII